VNIHNVMADIAADILRTVVECQGCKKDNATVYAVWHRNIDGQIGEAGGAYLCSTCRNNLELSGAVVRGVE
jgi:hypothetical protein